MDTLSSISQNRQSESEISQNQQSGSNISQNLQAEHSAGNTHHSLGAMELSKHSHSHTLSMSMTEEFKDFNNLWLKTKENDEWLANLISSMIDGMYIMVAKDKEENEYKSAEDFLSFTKRNKIFKKLFKTILNPKKETQLKSLVDEEEKENVYTRIPDENIIIEEPCPTQIFNITFSKSGKQKSAESNPGFFDADIEENVFLIDNCLNPPRMQTDNWARNCVQTISLSCFKPSKITRITNKNR